LVFGDSLHSEVIKKSYTFLEYLYFNGRIKIREFDKMWECATKKHEAYKVAILKALTFLATKASIEDLKYLFAKVKLIPLNEVDKFTLELVKAIAKKIVGDDSMAISSPKKDFGPSIMRFDRITSSILPRSNSGGRGPSKLGLKSGDGAKLNNSFSGMNEFQDGPKNSRDEVKSPDSFMSGKNKMD
jgi:hypothetical protein